MTDLTPEEYDFALLDNNQLLLKWDIVDRTAASFMVWKDRIEFELKRRMEGDGATAIAHPLLTCELKTPSPTYDTGKLRGLAELVPLDVLATGFTPAHEEVVMVPDKWNATKFKTWVKYGDAVTKVISDAAIPGTARVRITRKAESPPSQAGLRPGREAP